MSEYELQIKLLKLEIEALRSVLSEFSEKNSLDVFTQWNKAEAIRELFNHLKVLA